MWLQIILSQWRQALYTFLKLWLYLSVLATCLLWAWMGLDDLSWVLLSSWYLLLAEYLTKKSPNYFLLDPVTSLNSNSMFFGSLNESSRGLESVLSDWTPNGNGSKRKIAGIRTGILWLLKFISQHVRSVNYLILCLLFHCFKRIGFWLIIITCIQWFKIKLFTFNFLEANLLLSSFQNWIECYKCDNNRAVFAYRNNFSEINLGFGSFTLISSGMVLLYLSCFGDLERLQSVAW